MTGSTEPTFLSRAAKLATYQLLQRLVEFALIVVLAKILTPGDFGVVAAATIFIQAAQLLVEIGIGATVVQLAKVDERDLRVANTLVWANSLLYFLLAQALAGLAARMMGSPDVEIALRVLACVLLFQSIGVVAESLMLRRLEAARVAMQNLCVRALFGLGLGAVIAWLGGGYWALVIPTVLGALAKSVWTCAVARPPLLPLFDRAIARKLLRKGSGFSASRVINFIAIRADNFLVGLLFGVIPLGIYSRAYNLMNMPADLYGAIADRLVFPSFARVQDDVERLREAYLRGVEFTALIGLPLSAVLFILGEEWIRVILGPQWDAVVAPFQILVFATYFRLGMKITGSIQRAKGAVRSMIGTQAFYAALVVGGCLASYRFGLLALCASISVGVGIAYLAITASGLRLTGTRLGTYLKLHLPGAAIALLLTLLLAPLVHVERAAGRAPALILIEATGVVGLCGLALMVFRPRPLLGEMGVEFMIQAQQRLARAITRRRAGP